MKKLTKTQKIGGGIIGGVVLVGSFLGIRKAHANKHEQNFIEENFDANTQISPLKASFPLKYGQPSNAMLKRLQIWMNQKVIVPSLDIQKKIGVSKLKEDGKFGKNTLKAVRLIFKKDEVSKSIFKKIRA